MNSHDFFLRSALLVAAAMGILAAPAHGVNMSVRPSSIYQQGTSAGVYLGHTVAASTNMNRLQAGGSFRAYCFGSDTGTITGERSLPATGVVGPLQLYVTIPAQLPALRNMPGFVSLPRGTTLVCRYDWTAYARESTYSIGVPGISVPIGGGEISDSDSITFGMRKPGTATGEDDACIP